jgi:hypothetical protein
LPPQFGAGVGAEYAPAGVGAFMAAGVGAEYPPGVGAFSAAGVGAERGPPGVGASYDEFQLLFEFWLEFQLSPEVFG